MLAYTIADSLQKKSTGSGLAQMLQYIQNPRHPSYAQHDYGNDILIHSQRCAIGHLICHSYNSLKMVICDEHEQV